MFYSGCHPRQNFHYLASLKFISCVISTKLWLIVEYFESFQEYFCCCLIEISQLRPQCGQACLHPQTHRVGVFWAQNPGNLPSMFHWFHHYLLFHISWSINGLFGIIGFVSCGSSVESKYSSSPDSFLIKRLLWCFPLGPPPKAVFIIFFMPHALFSTKKPFLLDVLYFVEIHLLFSLDCCMTFLLLNYFLFEDIIIVYFLKAFFF